jgi:glycerol kinase
MIIGITRGTTPHHIARAALESMAFQTRDVVEEMKRVMRHVSFKTVRVDGGAVKNNFLMQFQADILNMVVERPAVIETTALGAAGIAGITSGFWDKNKFLKMRKIERVFHPKMDQRKRESYYLRWKNAASRSLKWAGT